MPAFESQIAEMIDTIALASAKRDAERPKTQTERPDVSDIVTKKQRQEFIRRHFEKIDFSKYEMEPGGENLAIAYYTSKEDPQDRLLRVIWPDSDYPIVFPVERTTTDEKLRSLTKTWAEKQKNVMIDEDFLDIVCEIFSRAIMGQTHILEGQPGVSKSYAAEAAAAMAEVACVRVSYSSGTRESLFTGKTVAEQKRKLSLPIERILSFPTVTKRFAYIKAEWEESKSMTASDRDFITALSTIYELKNAGYSEDELVLAVESLSVSMGGIGLVASADRVWADSDALYVYQHGGWAIHDEPNTVEDTGVLNKLLPFAEVKTDRVSIGPERTQGEVVYRHSSYHCILTQNPPGTISRSALPEPLTSRSQTTEVPPLSSGRIKAFFTFFITGNDPELRIKNRVMKGRQNVQTDYRRLESMPKLSTVIPALTDFHLKIVDMKKKGEIGRKKTDGGNYEFDQRDIEALLDAMIGFLNRRNVVENPNGTITEKDSVDWIEVIKSSLKQVYLSGLQGTESEGDLKKVNDFINGLPLWQILEASQKGGKNGTPDWVVMSGLGAKVSKQGNVVRF
jgi:hypothetical protein